MLEAAFNRAHAAGGAEQSAQSRPPASARRRTSPCSPSSACASTPWPSATKSGSRWCSTARATPPLIGLAGHARADGEDRLGRQDVRPDRLEGRLAVRRAGPDRRPGQGAPVPHLHHAAEPADARSPGAWPTATTGSPPCPPSSRARATGWPPPCAREGFAVLPSQGAYFLNVDLAASGIGEGDVDFCLRAVKEAGVAAIPLSAFYEAEPVTSIIRLCFAKRDETLDEGVAPAGEGAATGPGLSSRAAVDDDGLAGGPGAGARGQIDSRAGDIVRLAQAPQRGIPGLERFSASGVSHKARAKSVFTSPGAMQLTGCCAAKAPARGCAPAACRPPWRWRRRPGLRCRAGLRSRRRR